MSSFRPTTPDFTQPALFKFVFSRLPHVEYFCYSANVPGVNGGEILQPTPIFDARMAGDKMTFDPLIVNFIVNEDLANYNEILQWMFGIYKPLSTQQYRQLVRKDPGKSEKENKYSDADLFILTNKMNPIIKVHFVDVWPLTLGPLTYDATISDVAPITVDCTFSYMYHTIEKVT